MAIKPYPCCHFMHGALEALESLGLAADDVAQIDVRVADAGVGLILEPAADKPRPRTPYDAKFSLPFTAGALLVHGRVGVATFTAAGHRRRGRGGGRAADVLRAGAAGRDGERVRRLGRRPHGRRPHARRPPSTIRAARWRRR